jgi:hypothetical protein
MTMFIRAFTVYFVCSFVPLFTVAVQIARGAQPRLLPEGQALAALRAKAPDAEFAIIRTIDPEADATAAVMESLREARAKHPDRFSDNAMENLLQVGGYIVLQLDPHSETVTQLDYVSLDSAGKPLIEPREIEGKLSKDEALQLLQRHGEFQEAFLHSPSTEMKSLLLQFGGSSVAAHTGEGEHGCMDIPESVAKLPVRLDDEVDLISSSCSVQLWVVRFLLTISPAAEFDDGFDQYLDGLEKDLEKSRLLDGEMADYDDACDFESITTLDQLHTRIKQLKKLDGYLEKHFSPDPNSAAYKENLPLLSLPLGFGVWDEGERTYYAETLPGLVTMWSNGGNGELVLTGLGFSAD